MVSNLENKTDSTSDNAKLALLQLKRSEKNLGSTQASKRSSHENSKNELSKSSVSEKHIST